MVRVVTSTRVALSGMNRRSRAMARPGEGKGWAKAVLMSKLLQSWGLTLVGSLCRGAAPVKGSGGVEASRDLKSPWNLTLRACQRIWTSARSFAVPWMP